MGCSDCGVKMKISNINVKIEGYAHCKSDFYSAHDTLSSSSCYTFSLGVNKLIGEIDSGNWAISYLLSMYNHRPEDFILFDNPEVAINNRLISLNELSEISCYMDKIYPLFSTNDSVKKLIIQGLECSKLNYSYESIRNLFHIDSERFERPLTGFGNEIFRAMAAIGFAYGKEIFCFPWISIKRFESYHNNLIALLTILETLRKIVIIPTGISTSNTP